jgi:hypothetical protein
MASTTAHGNASSILNSRPILLTILDTGLPKLRKTLDSVRSTHFARNLTHPYET